MSPRRPRILLLHPPGERDRLLQLDGYCSQPQKGPFRWHPLDFAAFAAAWSNDADVSILDLGTRPDRGRVPATVAEVDAVVGLVGAWGWPGQLAFFRRVIAAGTPVFVSGDLARHEPAYVFSMLPGLAGILPELAAAPSVGELLDGAGVWRADADTFAMPTVPRGFRLGTQPFAAWNHALYRLPFSARRPWASVLTQVGCPHPCRYCILSGYTPAFRDLEDFAAELAAVRGAGARHLYVRDATLNSSPKHLNAVLPLLGGTGLPWNAFARLDGLGPRARDLRAAGCRVLQFGLETPTPESLGAWGKRWRGDPAAQELARLRAAGIATVGHFVLGLDGSDARAIADYAAEIGLDWATITPLMRRPGTDLWRAPKPNDADLGLEDDRAHAGAVAAALRRFYLRPRPIATITRRFAAEPALALRAAGALTTRG